MEARKRASDEGLSTAGYRTSDAGATVAPERTNVPSFTLHYFPDPPDRVHAYFVAVSSARPPAFAFATIVPLTEGPTVAQGDHWALTSGSEPDAIAKAKAQLDKLHPGMRCVETPLPPTLVREIARLLQEPTT